MDLKVKRSTSLRARLVLLVVGATLPVMLFAVVNAWLGYRVERDRVQEATISIARSMALGVAREVQRSLAGLSALALSRPLCRGELDAFRAQLETFVDDQHPGANATLSSLHGQQLINLSKAHGELLPERKSLSLAERTFTTGRAQVSGLYENSYKDRVISLEVPVTCEGRLAYSLALTPRLETFKAILEQQRPPAEWTILLIDAKGALIAHLQGIRRDSPSFPVPSEPVRVVGDEGVVGVPAGSSAPRRD